MEAYGMDNQILEFIKKVQSIAQIGLSFSTDPYAVDNYEELKRLEKFKTTLNIAMEANSALWRLTNDVKYRDWLHTLNENHRKKMKDIEAQIVLHS